LKKNLVIIIIVSVLVALAAVQATIDYISESDASTKASKASIKANCCIFVEIEDKTLYLLQDGKCIKRYPIASGKPGWPSPIGFWKIVNKGDWGEGFGGRWMGLNVTWGTYGIHGTMDEGSIGSSASHGCIRMFNNDVKDLYDRVAVGTPVVIVNGTFGPFGRGFTDIEPGDRGADVLAIQQRLTDLGYFKGGMSGIYEDDLKLAVHRFQKDKALEVKNTITKKDYLAMGFKDFE